VANREALIPELQREFDERPADEWAEELLAAGVPSGPVNTLADVLADEHLLGSGMLQDLDHPSAGHLKMLASPILIDGERLSIRRPPPTLGQHTEEGWRL
jgi:crotonobetainyl-CoA:carnitine CoA-transferase CaiB-like acyl-CoA transferase